MCVFAPHNFLKDPPFGRLDFISCRNVLIYMEPYLQKKALTTFHYALKPNGFLLLGKTETISLVPDLFASVARSDKLFSRKEGPGRSAHLASGQSETSLSRANENPKLEIGRTDFQKTADDLILARYTPAGVVVDEALDIVYFRGNTSRYLEQSTGKPTHNLLLLAKYGLTFELRNLLHKAQKGQVAVSKENIPLQLDNVSRSISIEAIPLPTTVDPHYLVLFHETDTIGHRRSVPPKGGQAKKKDSSANQDVKDRRIHQLEQELAQARDDMRGITQDQEAANEALQSANEELLSGNEELQSLNEELETGKEELQSTYEELTIVNQEMISLNEQLISARDAEGQANKRFQFIADAMPQKVWTADPGGNIDYYNQTWLAYTGLHFKDLKDWGWKQIIHPEDWEETKNRWQQSIDTGADFEMEHRFLNAEGHYKWHLSRGLAQKDATGAISLWIGTNTEIDQQKTHQKTLEKAVAERTHELQQANQTLADKNGELQQKNKELEAFTYVSSHDLQEPLRKIQALSGRILEKETLTERGKDSFQRMQKAAQRMQQLIHDLLAFSHLNAAERIVESTDLRLLVEEVAGELSDTMAEKRATLDATELGSAPIIEFQFRQLLHNLIGNALKFSNPEVPPHIILKSRMVPGSQLPNSTLSPEKTYCHILVEDNGIGFAPQYSEKIFAVFQRLHGRSHYKGTGIGLAIVKKVVENHQGLITATSEPGKGARFDIYIPA
ncbi:hypothetical protein GCM10027275_51900 [Rhabdobacter roseus]|uniref:histidine kinase n=2 Tax=Rhabdobacter roseus TaxID=1655419 RepID=A0A840TWG0_9BACT|nr:PAS domain S-box-containing protein [Rhabdobacter roseus]